MPHTTDTNNYVEIETTAAGADNDNMDFPLQVQTGLDRWALRVICCEAIIYLKPF